jgi:uncharacterized protein
MTATRRRFEHDLGGDCVLTVQLPEDYARGARDYPLLLCLDPQWTFGTVCDTALILGLARLVPRVVIAGLGWRHPQTRDVVVARSHAYTPTDDVFPPEVSAPDGRLLTAGGGPAHLDFVASAVMPLLTRTYRIAATERMLIGHSLSGLFGLVTAAQRPALFDRYLLASPSVWWHERYVLALLAGTTEVRGRVYMTMGEHEGVIAGCPMIETAAAAAGMLRERNPSCDTRFEVLPDEIHQSTIAGSVTRGLRWLFRAAP